MNNLTNNLTVLEGVGTCRTSFLHCADLKVQGTLNGVLLISCLEQVPKIYVLISVVIVFCILCFLPRSTAKRKNNYETCLITGLGEGSYLTFYITLSCKLNITPLKKKNRKHTSRIIHLKKKEIQSDLFLE